MEITQNTGNAIEEKIAADKLHASNWKKLKKLKRKKNKKIHKLESSIFDLQTQLDMNIKKVKHLRKKAKRYKKSIQTLLYYSGYNPFLDFDNLPNVKPSPNGMELFEFPNERKKRTSKRTPLGLLPFNQSIGYMNNTHQAFTNSTPICDMPCQEVQE
ncbi:MAG: hypothetical protein HFI12_00645 [Lachnospiraceae bacterium]|jgi:hypothetical protein|nr:hypothetical protein [Lachnospiraceae bacterium]